MPLTQRLETLGRHSLALMHDLNNLVTRLNFHLELAKMKPDSDHFEQATIVAGRASELCQGMTTYVRCHNVPIEGLDLTTFLREYVTRDRQQRQGGEMVLAVDTPLEEAKVAFNPFALGQLLDNLASNAFRAGSTLVIVRLRKRREAPAEIVVEDFGPGLPASVIEHFGEPFNSYHKAGTGLGIFLAAEIMRDHGGLLSARNKSAPLSGALFTLSFPGPAAQVGTTGDGIVDQAGI